VIPPPTSAYTYDGAFEAFMGDANPDKFNDFTRRLPATFALDARSAEGGWDLTKTPIAGF